MSPVRGGTSAEFWKAVSGIDLQGRGKDWWDGFYQPTNGWFIYYVQGMHGESLFRVPRAEAIKDFPEVVSRIRASNNDTNTTAKTRWIATVLQQSPPAGNDPERFLALVRDEKLRELRNKEERFYEIRLEYEKAFSMRWGRIQRYWLNVVFELAFFTGLFVFAFWPWLRSKGPKAWGIHLGLTVSLLFVPYYLGYCGWTFTSAGPSGGVLYPWTIVWFRNCCFWTPVDEWLFVSTPKILEPLSQTLGSMLAISGGGPLGVLAGLVIGFGIYVLFWLTSVLNNHEKTETPPSTAG